MKTMNQHERDLQNLKSENRILISFIEAALEYRANTTHLEVAMIRMKLKAAIDMVEKYRSHQSNGNLRRQDKAHPDEASSLEISCLHQTGET